LILSRNTFYGTAAAGGSEGNGTLFKVNTDGTGFSTLHSFTGGNTNSFGILTNYDGANPYRSLVLSNNTLYGTAPAGGSSGSGTVFKLNTDGTSFTTLYSFSASSTNSSGFYTNSDGAGPSTLILSSNTLYGTASGGGSSGSGMVFRLNTDGSGFRTLYDFTSRVLYFDDWLGILYTNSDGAWPNALVSSGDTLYGSAAGGGSSGNGTVFKVNTDGIGFTVYPVGGGGGGLILSGNTLYGTKSGSVSGYVWGDVFKVNIDGTGFTYLFDASFAYVDQGGRIPQLGWFAWGGLLLSGDTLYCTMQHTEPNTEPNENGSTLLAINTDGSGVATPYEFCEGGAVAFG
jgi:uncharacterized repeat protein (TIGR03803 family)